MKGRKIVGMVLTVAVMIFMVAPLANAQSSPGILHNQWFKVKASMKGYMLDGADNDNVLYKSSGSGTDYIKFTYAGDTYTLWTCTPDDYEPGIWHWTTPTDPLGLPVPRNQISKAKIYGAEYPQIWDFDGTPIVFFDGYSTFSLYPTLYTKITAPGGILTKATISILSCGCWADVEQGTYNAIGSCGLTGSLIPSTQVEKKVPEYCRLQDTDTP
jgi:hypothetical protein